MAGIDTIETAITVTSADADMVGTTLFGYTCAANHLFLPAWELLT
jgi:putative N-acetylmannosamine-6-phosphate epimerase